MSWVTERNRCTVMEQFEAMKREAGLRIAERNKALGREVFTLDAGGNGPAFLIEKSQSDAEVRFTCHQDKISIQRPGQVPMHLSLIYEDNVCLFVIGVMPTRNTCEEIVRIALENFLFG